MQHAIMKNCFNVHLSSLVKYFFSGLCFLNQYASVHIVVDNMAAYSSGIFENKKSSPNTLQLGPWNGERSTFAPVWNALLTRETVDSQVGNSFDYRLKKQLSPDVKKKKTYVRSSTVEKKCECHQQKCIWLIPWYDCSQYYFSFSCCFASVQSGNHRKLSHKSPSD